MRSQYNWISAALLAALLTAQSPQAVLAGAQIMHTAACTCPACAPGHDHDSPFHGVYSEPSSGEGTLSGATATIPEAAVDAIYAQASFGANPVNIEFGPVILLNDPSHLVLDNDAEIFNLFNDPLSAPSPGVTMFFVDAISTCGAGPQPNIVGCGLVGGNKFVVKSSTAAGPNGAELIAHELGHNLGLAHVPGNSNLMNPQVNGNTTLTASQVNAIRASIFSQGPLGSEFVHITPILVVPEPTCLTLVLPIFVAGFSLRCPRSRSG